VLFSGAPWFLRGLGDLQGGFSMAADVSEDGSVVVGFAEGPDGITAFVWDDTNGMQSLKDVLTFGGVDMTGWRLMHAEGISRDGKTIVGYGTNPSGKLEAFVTVIN
jgi:probable HAF family extracellular repeat protein